jgi:hypothetical protein
MTLGGKVINWGERGRPAKPRDDVQAMLIERGALGGGSKWLKDLVDDGSEERLNKGSICTEERLKFIEIDLIDTRKGRKLRSGLKEPRRGKK